MAMKRESTPVSHIDITDVPEDLKTNGGIWARLYWSKNSGQYGHQCVMEFNNGSGYNEYQTGGCGYCKHSAALEHFWHEVFGEYSPTIGGGDISWHCRNTDYHKGGNCYEIPYAAFKAMGERS